VKIEYLIFPKKDQERLNIEYLKRVKYTINSNLVMFLFFTMSGVSKYLNTGEKGFFTVLMFSNIFMLISLFLIRIRKYEIASLVAVLWGVFNLNNVNFFLPTVDYMSIYRCLLYITGGGIVSCLIIFKRRHYFIYAPLLFLSYVAFLVFRIFPLYKGAMTEEARSTIIAGFFVAIALLVLFYYILSFSKYLVEISEANFAKSNQQLKLMNRLFLAIKDNVSVLEKVKNESLENSETLSDNANLSATSVEEISATMEELTVSINNIAANSKETYENMASTVENSEIGLDYMKQSTESIDKLVSMTGKIEDFASEISDFTEHTTLLALNASIEAARAKEYGKGFSVLAKEIQKLAQKSAVSAQYISGIVKDANSSIIAAYEKNKSTSDIFNRINKKLIELSKTFYQISEASQEDSQGAQDVTSSLDDISKVSENTVLVSEQIQNSVRMLNDITYKLNSLIDKKN